MAFLPREVLQAMGFARLGADVRVSDRASLYNCQKIAIGENVRIDDFCVLSAGTGGIEIGSHVHIAVACTLIGAGHIRVGDFCNLSSRVAVYSSSDDYSGASMTNPTIGPSFKRVDDADVILGKHVIVGCGSVILPGANLLDGVAIGALSLVKGDCEDFSIYAGIPARRVKSRKRDLLALAEQFLLEYHRTKSRQD